MSATRPLARPREAGERAAPPAPGRRPRAGGAWLLLALGVLGVAVAMRFEGLAADALTFDTGIQFHLSRRTAGGAVPLVDFEHGWNAGSWYLGALLYTLGGGSATVWAFLREHLFGTFLAGAALLVAAWRVRLPGPWLLGLTAAFLWLVKVPHFKYATPAVWLLVLLPAGGERRGWVPPALRAGAAAVTFWAHVELAVLLGAGVALFDLFGARDLAPRTRLLRAAAVPAGILSAFALQAGVYAALGLAPDELVRQLLADPSRVDEQFHFGYPLLAPADLRMLVYPTSLVLAFVPAVWRRLSEPTRLLAFLHLSQALVAIRRSDPSHVAAATTLLAAFVVLAAHDLRAAPGPDPVRPRRVGARAASAALGALWFAAAVLVGFRVEAFAAVAGLTLVCLAGVAVARRSDAPWASLGALGAAGVLLLGGLGGHIAAGARATHEHGLEQAIAAEVRAPLDGCVGADRRVWVVPFPLGLYDTLDLTNPTPFTVFWYSFRNEHARVVALMDAGRVPAILQVNAWPPSFEGLEREVAARYAACATVPVPETGDTVTVWTAR